MILLGLGLRGRRVVFLLCWPQGRPSEDEEPAVGVARTSRTKAPSVRPKAQVGGCTAPGSSPGRVGVKPCSQRLLDGFPAPLLTLTPGSVRHSWRSRRRAPRGASGLRLQPPVPTPPSTQERRTQGALCARRPGRPGARATCRVKGSAFRRARHRQTRKSTAPRNHAEGWAQECEPQTETVEAEHGRDTWRGRVAR